jgi:hypothetical protein
LVHLSYQSNANRSVCRWQGCASPAIEKSNNKRKKAEKAKSSPAIPCRRSSIEDASLRWRSENIPHLQQKSPEALSCAKWAMALDVRFQDDDNSDEEEEELSTCSSFSFNDYESDSDDEDDDDDYDDDSTQSSTDSDSDGSDSDDDSSESESSYDEEDFALQPKELHTHDWVLPQNAILPNMQEILREAAKNPNMDIMARLMQSSTFSVAA